MSDAALICDTGALLDYLVRSAPDHQAFRDAIDGARARYVPGLVLAEVDYFLRRERKAMAALMRDLQRRAFIYVPPTLSLLARAMAIDREYDNLELGLVDACVVATAEDLNVRRLATRDVRDFAAVRLRGGLAFDLVVLPTRPDERKH